MPNTGVRLLNGHKRWRGLASQYRINVVQCKHAHRCPRLDGGTPNVGQEECVLEAKVPRMKFWFAFKNVQPAAAIWPLFSAAIR
jgi:hypothetical protein